jgi:hypothetical protein
MPVMDPPDVRRCVGLSMLPELELQLGGNVLYPWQLHVFILRLHTKFYIFI